MQVSEEVAYKVIGTAASTTLSFLHDKFPKCELAFGDSNGTDRTIACRTRHPKTERRMTCAISWLNERT
jgi:hypothetical protein